MYTHDQIKPASPEAAVLANAIIALMATEEALNEAKLRVPSYTGQWHESDYYAREQEAWNRAADALYCANGEVWQKRGAPDSAKTQD